ncbi:hypothetical protein DFH29DRAFT_875591 [Suillus ampliporus]|nr:hypothetical protein DFH29DRAFT_875591 [Suillus ampliporus]
MATGKAVKRKYDQKCHGILKNVTRSTYHTHEKYRLEDIAMTSSGTWSFVNPAREVQSNLEHVQPERACSPSPSSQPPTYDNDFGDLASDEIVHDSDPNEPQHSVWNFRRRFFGGGIVLAAFEPNDEFLDCVLLQARTFSMVDSEDIVVLDKLTVARRVVVLNTKFMSAFGGCSTTLSHTTMSGHSYGDTSDMSSMEPPLYRHTTYDARIQHDPYYSSTSDLSDTDSIPHPFFNDSCRTLTRSKTYDHDSFYQSTPSSSSFNSQSSHAYNQPTTSTPEYLHQESLRYENTELMKEVELLKKDCLTLKNDWHDMKRKCEVEVAMLKSKLEQTETLYEQLLQRMNSSANTTGPHNPFLELYRMAQEADKTLPAYSWEDYDGTYYWTKDEWQQEYQNGHGVLSVRKPPKSAKDAQSASCSLANPS